MEYTRNRDYSETSQRHSMVNETTITQLHSHPHYDSHSYLPQRNTQTSVIDQVRKWAIRYDDNSDPLEFIERLEESADLYAISTNMLPRTMPLLLEGQGLMWFRHNKKDWSHWEAFKRDFLKFFLPHMYFERLEDEIRNRLQKPEEPFKMYVLELQKLMRHAGLNQESQLDRIYRNMSTEYKIYIKRRDFTCLNELTIQAQDFEELRAEQNKVNRGQNREVIFGRVEVEYPHPMVVQNTVRRIPTMPICDKVIHSPISKSLILKHHQSSQQQRQTTAKQTLAGTARIKTSTIASIIPTQSTRQRNDSEQHPVSPQDRKLIKENSEIFKQQRVVQHHETSQVQLKQVQQEQAQRPIEMQLPEVQQDPKLKEIPEEFIQLRFTPEQEIPLVQLEKVQQEQQVQDPRAIKVQISEVQRERKPNVTEKPKELRQQQVTPEQEILLVQIKQAAQQQDLKPSKVQPHRDPSPGEETSPVVNEQQIINITQCQEVHQLRDAQEHVTQQQVQYHKTQQDQQEQLPHESNVIYAYSNEKLIKPLIQIKEHCRETQVPLSTISRQQQVNHQRILQLKSNDHHIEEQHDFYKIFKSPKKRHRSHAGR